jgi:hypothetical protein
MIIPEFYEGRWNKNIYCRKKYEDNKEKLDYLRTEYEIWALWIDKFYNGKYGIFNTIDGDAPRYALEYDLDFCIWEDTYKKNYLKRDHFSNQEVRSKNIIKRLTSLFNNAEKYILRTTVPRSPDEDINLDLEEIKTKMKKDPKYKEKWFKAAYEANDYIDKLLYNMNLKTVYPKINDVYTRNIYPKSNSRQIPKRKQSKKVSKRRKQSKKVSKRRKQSIKRKRRY